MNPGGELFFAAVLIVCAIFCVSHLGDISKELKRIGDACEKRNDLYCQKEGINRFK